MANLATVLKSEVARLARKELRAETAALKKAVASQRTDIVALKRRIAELERAFKALNRVANEASRAVEATPKEANAGSYRFRAAGMASNRRRLGLSAEDFGLLVGASGQSVYLWEKGQAKPRPKNLSAIAALRGLGKREVFNRLEALRRTS